jgi:NRAMP (natural resistance-associated macrophage protein)-like metal ion transporter
MLGIESGRKLFLRLHKAWKKLGPGLVTGASDDDPSGITTYSQAGAQYGTQLLWTALFTYPLMVNIQEMCARIGLVTGEGLTANIRKHYPAWILYLIVALSAPTIMLNIGANIAGMGAVGNMLFPQIPDYLFSVLFTGIMMYSFIFWNYNKIAMVLKWLCISLLSYILIPFVAGGVNWPEVLKSMFIPGIEISRDYLFMLVAILGTTISPYLFFWQASMEVEEKVDRRLIVDKQIISEMKSDVKGGMFFTNLVFFFIILSAAAVLNTQGVTNIQTVDDAARALKPLAGNLAYVLFAVGVIGTGFLAIPVLSGALSYMMSETFGWTEGLNKKFHQAKGFYVTMIISLLTGLSINLFGISPIQALIYTAVLYGITAPVLIGLILHMCNKPTVMQQYTNGLKSNLVGGITLLLMISSSFFLLYYTLAN